MVTEEIILTYDLRSLFDTFKAGRMFQRAFLNGLDIVETLSVPQTTRQRLLLGLLVDLSSYTHPSKQYILLMPISLFRKLYCAKQN
jgi:hypothetical protein